MYAAAHPAGRVYSKKITRCKRGREGKRWKERERERHEKLVSLVPPLQSEHVQSFLFPELHASPFDPVGSAWLSRTGHRMRALGLALLHREETWTSKRGQKEKLKPRVLGERRQTAYQRLIKTWRVICTVRPLRIGIKTEEVRGRTKGKRGGREGDGVGSLGERIREISFI